MNRGKSAIRSESRENATSPVEKLLGELISWRGLLQTCAGIDTILARFPRCERRFSCASWAKPAKPTAFPAPPRPSSSPPTAKCWLSGSAPGPANTKPKSKPTSRSTSAASETSTRPRRPFQPIPNPQSRWGSRARRRGRFTPPYPAAATRKTPAGTPAHTYGYARGHDPGTVNPNLLNVEEEHSD